MCCVKWYGVPLDIANGTLIGQAKYPKPNGRCLNLESASYVWKFSYQNPRESPITQSSPEFIIQGLCVGNAGRVITIASAMLQGQLRSSDAQLAIEIGRPRYGNPLVATATLPPSHMKKTTDIDPLERTITFHITTQRIEVHRRTRNNSRLGAHERCSTQIFTFNLLNTSQVRRCVLEEAARRRCHLHLGIFFIDVT